MFGGLDCGWTKARRDIARTMAIDPGNVAVILLAAGQSRRFGHCDKLVQPYRCEPLVAHAARTLATIPFAAHIAVADGEVASLLPDAFRAVANPDPGRGLSSSIGVGLAALDRMLPTACMIALADMPLVPKDHFEALMHAFEADDPQAMVATCSPGGKPIVPALFGQVQFGALRGLTGDRGARALLANAPTVTCDPALLADFDRPSDFAG